MIPMKVLLPCCCLILLIAACQKTFDRNVNAAFYHWKSTLDISAVENNYLKVTAVKKIYLRFFDVDWDGAAGEPLPIAVLNVRKKFLDSFNIIPTVFITNRTFLKITPNEVGELADNVLKKINELATQFPNHKIKEWQFDCDWSPKTQDKYFAFLKAVKSKNQQKKISSTIRLHQIKYFEKTGVPPVDRGVLMFYNMGNLEDIHASNSILDLSIAKKYLDNFENYALPLDVALPIFSWGVLIREGRMIKLINNLRASDLTDEVRFLKIDETHFEIIKSTYLQGYYLYEGDILRLESVSVDQLNQSADLLSPLIENTDLNIVFYHLDSMTIINYPHEVLENICNRFR